MQEITKRIHSFFTKNKIFVSFTIFITVVASIVGIVKGSDNLQLSVADSPGSIIAPSGGTNTVVNTTSSPSLITDEKRKIILELLGSERFATTIWNGSSASQRLVEQISSLLLERGWVVEYNPQNTYMRAFSGVAIAISDLNAIPKGAKLIYTAFKSADLPFETSYYLDLRADDSFFIIVGDI